MKAIISTTQHDTDSYKFKICITSNKSGLCENEDDLQLMHRHTPVDNKVDGGTGYKRRRIMKEPMV